MSVRTFVCQSPFGFHSISSPANYLKYVEKNSGTIKSSSISDLLIHSYAP